MSIKKFEPKLVRKERIQWVKPTWITEVYGIDNDYRLADVDLEVDHNKETLIKCIHGRYRTTIYDFVGTIGGCELEWNLTVPILRSINVDMIPIFIAKYEELLVRDAISIPETMFPHNRRVYNVVNDNKIVIIWQRIKGTGSIYIATQHKNGQVRIGTMSKVDFYHKDRHTFISK